MEKKPEDINLTLDEQFGKIFPLVFNEETREDGYKQMEELFDKGYIEAGILLGQYYSIRDKRKAEQFFEAAANADIAEGMWGLSGFIPHNHVPLDNEPNDIKWVGTVLNAAKLGCPDAMNEAGNIENRRNNYFASAYWYGMAELYEHPEGVIGCKGIAKRWVEAGRPDIPSEHIGDPIYEQGKLMIRTDADEDKEKAWRDIEKVCLNDGYSTLALLYAEAQEKIVKNNVLAYKFYQVAAMGGDIYANRACADMLASGAAGEVDLVTAEKLYNHAATRGEKNSCFVMGEFERNRGNKYLANSWYAKAVGRGLSNALQDVVVKRIFENNTQNNSEEKTQDVYWRNEQGKIVCKGDNCEYGNRKCPDDCPIMLNTKGIEKTQDIKYRDAVNLFKEAVSIAPDFKDAWCNMGAAYALSKEFRNAYNAYKKAYELDNNYRNALYGLMLSCRDLNNPKECLEWCEKYEMLYKDMACERIKMQAKIDSVCSVGKQKKILDYYDIIENARNVYLTEGENNFIELFTKYADQNYLKEPEQVFNAYLKFEDIFDKLDEKHELDVLDSIVNASLSKELTEKVENKKNSKYKKEFLKGWHRK